MGETKQLWDQLITHVKEKYIHIVEDWKHYGKNSGWTLKLLLKKRNLFFLYPNQSQFYVVFVFGEKAVQAVAASSVPRDIVAALESARRYAEGRGLQITVSNQQQLEIVKTLLQIKIEN